MTSPIVLVIVSIVVVITWLKWLTSEQNSKVLTYLFPKNKSVLLAESIICLMGGGVFILGGMGYTLFDYIWILPVFLQLVVLYIKIKSAIYFFRDDTEIVTNIKNNAWKEYLFLLPLVIFLTYIYISRLYNIIGNW